MSAAATTNSDQLPVEGQAVRMETEEGNVAEAHMQTLDSLLVAPRAALLTAEEVAAIRALLEQNRAMKLKLDASSTRAAGKRRRFEDEHTSWESVDGEAQEQDTAANVDGDTFEGLYGADAEADLSSRPVRVDSPRGPGDEMKGPPPARSPSAEALAACKYVCDEVDSGRLDPFGKHKIWQWHMLNAQPINKEARRNLWHHLRHIVRQYGWWSAELGYTPSWVNHHHHQREPLEDEDVPSVAELLDKIKHCSLFAPPRGWRTGSAPLFELPGIGGRLRHAVFHVMSQAATMTAGFGTVFGAPNENPKAFRWYGWSVYHQALTEEFAPDPLRTQFGQLEWSHLLRTDIRNEWSRGSSRPDRDESWPASCAGWNEWSLRARRPDPVWLTVARERRIMALTAFSELWIGLKAKAKEDDALLRILTEWRGEYDEDRRELNMTLVELAKEIRMLRKGAGMPTSSQLDQIIHELEDIARIPDVHTCTADKVTHAENVTSLGIVLDASLGSWIKDIMVELPEFRTLVEHRRIMPALLNKVTGYDQFFEHPSWKGGLVDAMRSEHEKGGHSFPYRSTFRDAVRFSSNMEKHPDDAFMSFFCAQFHKRDSEVQKRTKQLKAIYYCFLRTSGVAPNILGDIRKVRAESRRRIRVLGWGDLHYAVWAADVGDVAKSIYADDEEAARLDNGCAREELRELAERHLENDGAEAGDEVLPIAVKRSPRDWNDLALKLLNEKPQKTEEDDRELEARAQIRGLLGPSGEWEAQKIRNAEWYASEKKLATTESDEMLLAEVAAVVDAEKKELRRLEKEGEDLDRKKEKSAWQRQQTEEKIARLEGVSAAEARAYFWEQLPQDLRAELRKQKAAATTSSWSSATSCSVPENADVSPVSTTGASFASDAAPSLETSVVEDESPSPPSGSRSQ